jgi:4-amino-4-deoxy-L-arabinose transferase-like glycosyltransferase
VNELVASKPKSALPKLEFDGTVTPAKTLLFVVLCVCWLVPGLVGHDPWKPEEAHTFGVVHDMMKSGDYVVPTLAGETYLDKPPLYFWSAAFFARALSPLLAPHDAARLTTGFYMVATLVFMVLSGATLFGRRFGRTTALILLGSFGLLFNAHAMVADSALLAGTAMAVYGLALARTPGKTLWAGAFLGTGVGIGFLAKGLMAPLAFTLAASAMWLVSQGWRTPAYRRSLLTGLAFVLPWLLWWPLALYARSPQHFQEWLFLNELASVTPDAIPGVWLEAFAYYAGLLPWYAWPALLLAVGGLWYRGRAIWREPQIQLLIVLLGAQLLALSLLGERREIQAMPMLVPLSLLGASGVDGMRRGAASALDWFGMMTFGLLAAALWVGWFALVSGTPQPLYRMLRDYMPGFEPRFAGGAFLLAALLSCIWLVAITRARQSNRRAVVNWAAGISMFWMLAMTLWLPYVDHAKSYRGMITSLREALPSKFECVASRGLGEPQRAMLDYYIGLRTQRLEKSAYNNCDVLLIQGRPLEPPDTDPRWRKLWEGSRPGDHVERFWLYRKS